MIEDFRRVGDRFHRDGDRFRRDGDQFHRRGDRLEVSFFGQKCTWQTSYFDQVGGLRDR